MYVRFRSPILTVLAVLSLLTLPVVIRAGGTGSTQLFTPQGDVSTTANGDFVADTGGLNTYYSYFVEVPSGTSRLVVDIFDADIGVGGATDSTSGRDRNRLTYGSTATYSLRDPSGSAVTTNFTTGTVTGPTGADNAWLTLYDSSSNPAPTLATQTTNTTGGATSLTLTVPAGTASGDLLIATVSVDGSNPITAPAGWATVSNGGDGSGNVEFGVFQRTATGSEPASYTFTWGGSASATGAMLRFTGVHPTTPVGPTATNTGNSGTAIAPSVVTTQANTLILRVFGADRANIAAAPAGHTQIFSLLGGGGGSANGSGGATITQGTAGATGTASFGLSRNEQWRAVSVTINSPTASIAPSPGHWEVRVDMGDGTANATDINAFGIRAHDGDTSSGGTELNVYYHSFTSYGIQDDGVGATGANRSYTNYPYVTAGCNAALFDFDWDYTTFGAGSTAPSVTGRDGTFTQSGTTYSGNNVWQETLSITGWTTDFTSVDYGMWQTDLNIDVNISSGNYGVVYFGTDNNTGTPPTSQPEAETFRVYLPTDAGAKPVKPYVEQLLTYKSGPMTPTLGQTTVATVTIRVVNPTAHTLTFSASNTVTANVPGSGATFNSIEVVEQGSVTSQPAVNGTGNVVWNPGTVAAGDTVLLAYNVNITPTSAGQRVVVTGTPASNGTTATYVDETCSGASPACSGAQLTGATFGFGPLCELAATEAAAATVAVIAEVAAYREQGDVVVEWNTVAEAGSVQFELLRQVGPNPNSLAPVHPTPVPALLEAPAGGVYRLVDPRAQVGEIQTYWLRETDIRGRKHLYGPFPTTVTSEPQNSRTATTGAPMEAAFEARPHALEAVPAARTLRSLRNDPKPGRKATSTTLKLGIRETGIYFLSVDDLAAALGANKGTLQSWLAGGRLSLTRDGQAIRWADGRGPGGERGLLFYGEATDSLFSQDNVYILRGGVPGQQMATVDPGATTGADPAATYPSRIDQETDLIGVTVLGLDPNSDYWFWTFLRAGERGNDSRTFPIQAEAASGGPGRLTVRFHGATDSGATDEHHVQLLLNGTLLGDAWFEGIEPAEISFPVPAGVTVDGENTVEVAGLLDAGVPFSIVFIDGFALTYDRAYTTTGGVLRFNGDGTPVALAGLDPAVTQIFEITDPANPRQVVAASNGNGGGNGKGNGNGNGNGGSGATLALSPTPGAEYLAVEEGSFRAPEFVVPVFPAGLTSSGNQGEYVVIAPPELEAGAARLAQYRASQGLTVKQVRLEDIYNEFSDGQPNPWAIRDFLTTAVNRWQIPPQWVVLVGLGSYDYRNLLGQGGNLMPPVMLQTPDGLYAADNALADLVGDDGVPEVSIGRIPAATAAELTAYLNKLTAYEATDPGDWAERVLLLSDAFDQGMDFAATSERIDTLIPTPFTTQEVDLTTTPIAQARSQTLGAWSQGVGLVHYTGHGGIDRFSASGLVTKGDAPGLNNGGRLPLVTAMTCTVNRYEVPGFRPLGTTLLVEPSGGAVAVWAPTGFSFNGAASQLAQHFYNRLLPGRAETLGDAVRDALGRLQSLDEPRHMRLIYNLLGDPALRLQSPPLPPPPPPGGPQTE